MGDGTALEWSSALQAEIQIGSNPIFSTSALKRAYLLCTKPTGWCRKIFGSVGPNQYIHRGLW